MHLPAPSPTGPREEMRLILDTPWVPSAAPSAINNYCFPELMDYYVAKGCRLCINSTASPTATASASATRPCRPRSFARECSSPRPTSAARTRTTTSGVAPSSARRPDLEPRYAGMPFTAEGADERAMYTATIDLALATALPLQDNPAVERHRLAPRQVRQRMFADAMNDPSYGK